MNCIRNAILILLLTYGTVYAQVAPPFWNDIVSFKQQDLLNYPLRNGILFIGSSSFTRWNNIHSAFAGYPIVNRGFGGSMLPHLIRYSYDIIIPYRPKQVIIYCGENDFASSDSISVAEVVKRFKTLFGMIRENLPMATIDFISMKPSPVRAGIQSKVKEANRKIRLFLNKQKDARFIDIYPAMLDKHGNMREDLYVEDRLHMKPEGYLIWQKIIQPYLLKGLQ